MADRRDYYFLQKVTEAELDAGFNGLEQADFNLAVDQALTGVVDGLGVAEKSGTPNLTVDVAAGTAYSRLGERISFPTTQNVDVSVDDSALSTDVVTSGNEKWVSVYIEFDRALSDVRLDGSGVNVFFVRAESFVFSVIQGAEAPAGTATRPAIDPTKILLADILRYYGQTTVVNGDLDITRREDVYRLTGTVPLVAGTPLAAVTALLTALNQHIDGAANKHPAADVSYAGSGNWYDSTAVTSPDVESAIDEVVADLAANGSPDGANKVGFRSTTGEATWYDSSVVGAGSIRSAILAIISTLAASTGAAKMGAAAAAGSPYALVADSIQGAIGQVLGFINAHANLATAAHAASAISNVATGVISSTTVQAAIDEIATEFAHLASSNTFTNALLFNRAGDENPSWQSDVTPTVAKLIARILLGSSTYGRWYAGADGSMGISVNCALSAGTTWTADNTALPAHIFTFKAGGLQLNSKAVTTSPWTTWDNNATLDADGVITSDVAITLRAAASHNATGADDDVYCAVNYPKKFTAVPSSYVFSPTTGANVYSITTVAASRQVYGVTVLGWTTAAGYANYDSSLTVS